MWVDFKDLNLEEYIKWLEEHPEEEEWHEGGFHHRILPLVYLAGPMQGCTKGEIHGWRLKVQKELEELGLTCTFPYDIDKEGNLTNKEIVDFDCKQVMESLIVFAYMWKPSIGTAMEIAVARNFGKIVICVTKSSFDNPFLQEFSTKVVKTIKEGIEEVKNQKFTVLY